MKAADVLFLIESLKRRTAESPEWSYRYLRPEVLWVADLCEQWLEHSDYLQHELIMIRSLAVLYRPRAALMRLEMSMTRLAVGTSPRINSPGPSTAKGLVSPVRSRS